MKLTLLDFIPFATIPVGFAMQHYALRKPTYGFITPDIFFLFWGSVVLALGGVTIGLMRTRSSRFVGFVGALGNVWVLYKALM